MFMDSRGYHYCNGESRDQARNAGVSKGVNLTSYHGGAHHLECRTFDRKVVEIKIIIKSAIGWEKSIPFQPKK